MAIAFVKKLDTLARTDAKPWTTSKTVEAA